MNDSNEIKIFREMRGEHSYYGLEGTEIIGTVPGLFKELEDNRSFLPSLQHNAEFLAVLKKFDLNGGRVDSKKREEFRQLQRSKSAYEAIASKLKKMGKGRGHVDAFEGVIKHAGSGISPWPRCAFIDACL